MSKRRITIEQVKELSDIQRKKLRDWWKPEEGDAVCYIYETSSPLWVTQYKDDTHMMLMRGNKQIPVYKEDCLPLLDIGQMIELLGIDCWASPEITFGSHLEYIVRIEKEEGEDKGTSFIGDVLCDVLWNAMKMKGFKTEDI